MKRWMLIILFYFTMASNAFAQCVMCKAQAEAQAEEDGSSINSGIIYIMLIPYIILFVVFHKKIFKFLKELKKAKG